MSRFHTEKGLFGQLIHYKDGVRVGESWPGLLKGTYNHYSNEKGFVGYSDPGFFADQIHRNARGDYVGESWNDDFGITRHYDRNGFAGESHDSILSGTTTNLFEDQDRTISLFEESSTDDSSGFDW